MGTRLNFGLQDNSGEKGFFNVPTYGIEDGTDYDNVVVAQGDFSVPLVTLSLAVLNTTTISVNSTVSTDRSTEVYAHRETAVRFIMSDSGGNQVVASIPAPDLAQFPFSAIGQDTTPVPYAGMSAGVTAMVAALEDHARHPITGEAVTVVRLDFVGRSN